MSIEDHLKGNEISHNAAVNLKKLQEFRARHDMHVEKKSPDPTGHNYSVEYTPHLLEQ